MSLLRRSRRQGMIVGAAVGSSRARRQAQQQAAPAAAPAEQPTTDDTVEQIRKFAELRDQGILTDAEFEAKKKQLLGL